MNERRRRLLETTGIVLATGLAGCSEGPSGDTGGDSSDDSSGNGGDESSGDDGSSGDESGSDESGSMESGQSLVINNVGASAWEVVEDESGSVAPTGEENPTLTFEVGQRYDVENRGWSAHPFALRAADDTPLLSQSTDGEFGGDGEVDFVDDGETLAFTVTEDLAAELDYYICTVHASMRGDAEAA